MKGKLNKMRSLEKGRDALSINNFPLPLLLNDQGALLFNDFPLVRALDKNMYVSRLSNNGSGFAFAHQLSADNGGIAKNGCLHFVDTENNVGIVGLQKFQPFRLVDHGTIWSYTVVRIIK